MTTKSELREVLRVYRRGPDGDWHAMPSTPAASPSTPTPRPRIPDRATLIRIAAVVLLPVVLGVSIWYGVATLQAAPAPQEQTAVRRATPLPTPRRIEQPAPTANGPQQRLLGRDCVYPTAPQGTVIRGYYTDKDGKPRDAVCRADGWKAID